MKNLPLYAALVCAIAVTISMSALADYPSDPPTSNDYSTYGFDYDLLGIGWCQQHQQYEQYSIEVKCVCISVSNTNFTLAHSHSPSNDKVAHYHLQKDYGDSGSVPVDDGNRYWDASEIYDDPGYGNDDIRRLSDCTDTQNCIAKAYDDYGSANLDYWVNPGDHTDVLADLTCVYELSNYNWAAAVEPGDRFDAPWYHAWWAVSVDDETEHCTFITDIMSWKNGSSGVYAWYETGAPVYTNDGRNGAIDATYNYYAIYRAVP